ncbi:hypothetical protein V6N12_028788 [Hibiscus sabdariffa]|uniref:Uncharacterized protein n=1 Tax=Hibiscus sabdariffa TaxID=183260 RepID=A0ABR2F6U8_9ROSI
MRRGLGSSETKRALNNIIFKFQPCLIFLMETKQKSSKLEKLRRRCLFTNRFYVEPKGKVGGLALHLIKPRLSITSLKNVEFLKCRSREGLLLG